MGRKLTLLGWLLGVKYLGFWVFVVHSEGGSFKGGFGLKEWSSREFLLSDGFLKRIGPHKSIMDIVEVGGQLIDGLSLVIREASGLGICWLGPINLLIEFQRHRSLVVVLHLYLALLIPDTLNKSSLFFKLLILSILATVTLCLDMV